VDGHDIGSGERNNIFLFTEDTDAAFDAILPAFFARNLTASLKAGYREVGG